MLNLVRVEAAKLFRGRAFWITVVLYMISITATFIPLSYTGALPDFPELSVLEQANLQEELREAEEMLEALLQSDSFVQAFYQTSSGQPMVVMIFLTLFVFAEMGNGTLQGTLLSGYSRRQVYLAKLACGVLGSAAFYALAMVNATFIGLVFYNMRFDAGVVGILFQVLLAQCVASIQYAAVFVAFAFLLGNGWAYLASTLFFLVVPGLPLLFTLLRGRSMEFATNYLPSFIGVNGLEGFVTLDMMLANPAQWTPGFLIPAVLVWLAITLGATWLGMAGFARKRL